MRKEETIQQKAIKLKAKYGKEKAIEILTNDRKRYDRDRTYWKSDQCKQAIQRIEIGMI